ncbi:hypothetical protein KKH39_02010 [Patescibacteria group bacterium]|nr:hypothetical protein [Patescibacteria group bacterium]
MFFSKFRFFVGFLAIFSGILLMGASCQNNQDLYNQNNSNIVEEQLDNQPLIGGDKDEYGCLISAGYSWCETKNKCLRTWEEECSVVENSNQNQTIPVVKTPDSIVDSVDWQIYENKKFGYTVLYPDNTEIIANNLDEFVEFVGPLQDGERWPRISISHFDTVDYHPEVGVNLQEWLEDSIGSYETRVIGIDGGIETLHVIQPQTVDSDGADYYYFVKDGQLFKITFLHTIGSQDWPMYIKFLYNFHFNVPTTNDIATTTPAQ